MSLTAEQIAKNYEKHLKIIDHYIVDRGDLVKTMLNDLEDTYVMAPASGKSWYHNAFAGGYVDHVNRVVEYFSKTSTYWTYLRNNIIRKVYNSTGAEVDVLLYDDEGDLS